MIRLLTAVLILFLVLPSASTAATFDDDFSAGAQLCAWRSSKNQTLYTMVDSNGEVRFSKPAGGALTFQYIALDFLGSIQGDFDVSIAFRNASIDRINGSPANQIQLNVQFGG
jgi:hypothetical protein